MTRPAVPVPTGTWPRPPLPPEPPQYPPPSPWRPEPRPSAAPAPSMQVVVAAEDRLAERLLDRRIVALAGELDADTVNRTVASTPAATSPCSCGSPASPPTSTRS
jgi:ATP-dependent Clp protease, protease subunit